MANGSKTEWVDPKGKTLKQSKYKSKKEVKKILKKDKKVRTNKKSGWIDSKGNPMRKDGCPEGYHKVEIKSKNEELGIREDPTRKKTPRDYGRKKKFRCIKDSPPPGIRKKDDDPRRPNRP